MKITSIDKLCLRLLCATSAASLLVGQAWAQDSQPTDEIIVVGVRAAQEAAIDVKRSKSEVVDSIIAEDIGKLPDTTITDALQRITGIQIDRDAGEGSSLAIRGQRSVLATLNGERFITAETLLETNAAFQDIPASLVSGVDVYKSTSAGNLSGGTGGIVDIRTRRALKLDEGLTATGSIQGRYGSITKDADWAVEGLVGKNWNDRTAMSLSGSYSDSTNASPFQNIGTDPDYVDEFNTWVCNGGACGDLNGDGDDRDFYLTPIGWNSTVNNREFERKRLGLAYNFNHQLNDAWEVSGDAIYNEMDERQNGQQIFVNGGFAGRTGFGPNNGSSVGGLIDASDYVGRWHPDGDVPISWVTEATFDRTGFRAGVESVLRETEALNTNLQFDYDNGGLFTGSIRGVYSDATRDASSAFAVGQTDALCIARSQMQADSGTCTDLNPTAISGAYQNSIALGEDEFTWTVDPALAQLAASPDAWRLHSNWYENNVTTADQLVLRADGTQRFGENFSYDFGVRFSKRGTSETRQDYFSPSGVNGLLNKFGEPGYALGQAGATGGTAEGLTFDPLPAYTFNSPELAPFLTNVSDFNVNGLNLTLPMLDSAALLDNFTGFRDALYGEGQFIAAPDRSYRVDEEQISAYVQSNFEIPFSEAFSLSGNFGLRVVKTTFDVTQNEVSDQLDQRILAGTDPNHSAYVDAGDIVTTNSKTIPLPSLNLNGDIGETIRVKFAWEEAQSQPRYEFLGRGPITFFETERPGENFQRVSSVQRLGNPNLTAELAEKISLALEWYPTQGTILTAGYFKNDLKDFTFTRTTPIAAVDSDGVLRNGATLLERVNGEDGGYEGYEFAFQTSFDYLPGFLSNTGITANYTYSPSDGGTDQGVERILAGGDDVPLGSTSEHQANLIGFYEDEKFQFRLAANYLSDQFSGTTGHWSYEQTFPAGNSGLGVFTDDQIYVDMSASYNINEQFQVFVNGSNITEEAPKQYRAVSANRNVYNQFESIWSLGLKGKF